MTYDLKFFKELFAESSDRADIDKGTVQAIFKEDEESLFVVFRSSDSTLDWWNHMLFDTAVIPYDNTDSKVRIHFGWLDQYKQSGVRDVILNRAREFYDRKPAGTVVVTGHSYGGALATICSLDVQYNFDGCSIFCLPGSSPRVGNAAFVKSFEKRVRFLAIYYGADIVHFVPPRLFGYKGIQMLHFGPRKVLQVLGNTLLAIWWALRRQPRDMHDVELFGDHAYRNYPDDIAVII